MDEYEKSNTELEQAILDLGDFLVDLEHEMVYNDFIRELKAGK